MEGFVEIFLTIILEGLVGVFRKRKKRRHTVFQSPSKQRKYELID